LDAILEKNGGILVSILADRWKMSIVFRKIVLFFVAIIDNYLGNKYYA
jgi:ubiquitin-protein ligase